MVSVLLKCVWIDVRVFACVCGSIHVFCVCLRVVWCHSVTRSSPRTVAWLSDFVSGSGLFVSTYDFISIWKQNHVMLSWRMVWFPGLYVVQPGLSDTHVFRALWGVVKVTQHAGHGLSCHHEACRGCPWEAFTGGVATCHLHLWQRWVSANISECLLVKHLFTSLSIFNTFFCVEKNTFLNFRLKTFLYVNSDRNNKKNPLKYDKLQ